MSKIKNIINAQYGNYIVIDYDVEKSKDAKRKYLICECIEHKIRKSIRYDSLIHKKGCDCSSKDINKVCIIEDCNEEVFCKNYCSKHYYKYNKYKDPLFEFETLNKICSICGANEEMSRIIKNNQKYFCQRHYNQIYTKGYIYRKTFQGNEYIEKENHYELIILNIEKLPIATVLIDKEDYEIVKDYYWHLNDSGYAITYIENEKRIRLHRLIMKAQSDEVVDHINHNTLDNRKINLRLCKQLNNLYNKCKQSNNTSGIIGVYFDKRLNKWISQIKVNKQKIHLGCFLDINDAIITRQEAEIKYFGEYRYDINNDYRFQKGENTNE